MSDRGITQRIWYFAYGSNLSKSQIKERLCYLPKSCASRLQGYHIAFNKLGSSRSPVFANIVPDESAEVWGVIYRFRSEDWEKMDRNEVVPTHYRRQKVNVLTMSGTSVKAETYVAAKNKLCPEAQPSQEYAKRILDGAIEHRLPQNWITKLKDIMGLAGFGHDHEHTDNR